MLGLNTKYGINRLLEYVAKGGKHIIAPPSADQLRETLLYTPRVLCGCIRFTHMSQLSSLGERQCDNYDYPRLFFYITIHPKYTFKMEEFRAIFREIASGKEGTMWAVKTSEEMGDEIRVDYAYYE